MKEDIDSIIRLLEKAQALMDKERYGEAKTTIYYAQDHVQHLKDQINRNT